MEIFLIGYITEMADKYPVLLSIVAYMGMARLILKPTITFLHEVVLITPSKKDDIYLEKAKGSKIYKAILWILDFAFSLKLKKPNK